MSQLQMASRAQDAANRPASLQQTKLKAAVLRAQACADILTLPCAIAVFRAPLHPATDVGSTTVQCGLASLPDVVAQAASTHRVEAKDVRASLEGSSLRCEVRARGGASVRAIVEVIFDVLQCDEDRSGLRAVLAQVGVMEEDIVVLPQWSLERVQAQVFLESEYRLELQALDSIVEALAHSDWEFRVAWAGARLREPGGASADLARRESLAFYEGSLVPIGEGWRCRLREDWTAHTGGDDGEALEHWLTNLPEQASILEKADEQLPRFDRFELGGHFCIVSRVAVVFESATGLLQALDGALQALDVRWVHNLFRTPSCSGHRAVSVGVLRQGASKSPAQVDELQLGLQDVHLVKQGRAQALFTVLQSVLERSGVSQGDMERVQQLVLRAFDYTDGHLSWDAAQELKLVAERASSDSGAETPVSKTFVEAALARIRSLEQGVASEISVQREARLAAALRRVRANNSARWKPSTSLRAACFRLAVPLRPVGKATRISPGLQAELEAGATQALVSRGVEGITCTVGRSGKHLVLLGRIHGCASVLAAVDALSDVVQENDVGIVGHFHEAGAMDVAPHHVSPQWPLELGQLAIEQDCGCRLAIHQLETLVPMMTESRATYDTAWQEFPIESRRALVEVQSLSSFGGQLLPVVEGLRRGLERDLPRQGAASLSDAMADAAIAQQQLKERVAPDTQWSEARLNALEEVPADHPSRAWRADDAHPMPNALFYDPGIMNECRVMDMARCETRPLEPDIQGVMGISGLDIVFESAEGLLQALGWITENLDLVWLDNQFKDPLCLGYRCIGAGVRQIVSTGDAPMRGHISELRLALRTLREVKVGEGARLEEAMRSVLAGLGVRRWELKRALTIFLRAMDCTDGKAADIAAQDLRHIVAKTCISQSTTAGDEASTASDLVQEFREAAACAGVEEGRLQQCMAPPVSIVRVSSRSSCCRAAVGRVEILLGGSCAGETPEPSFQAESTDEPPSLDLQVQERTAEMTAKLSGQLLYQATVSGTAPITLLMVEVPIAVFVYVQMIDDESQLEFVFVCGDIRDMPDEEARPFVGEAVWDGGKAWLDELRPLELGDADCLRQLQSLVLRPDLPDGRCFEAVEWEDTSAEGCCACQFQRCLVNPVRVGKIYTED